MSWALRNEEMETGGMSIIIAATSRHGRHKASIYQIRTVSRRYRGIKTVVKSRAKMSTPNERRLVEDLIAYMYGSRIGNGKSYSPTNSSQVNGIRTDQILVAAEMEW